MNKENYNNKSSKLLGVLYVVLVIVAGVGIVWKMVDIQWVHGDDWRARAKEREASMRTEPAQRGDIYSSDGKILATTVPVCDLYLDLYNTIQTDKDGKTIYDKNNTPRETGPIVDSNFTKYLDSVCEMLAEAVPTHSADYYRDRINAGRAATPQSRCLMVQRAIPYSVWRDICRVPGWGRGVVKHVDGESVIRQVRAHIYGNMAENVIGFRNSWESRSYTGLEGYYDSILRGRDGVYNCRRLTRGMWLPDPPTDGSRVSSEHYAGEDTIVYDTTVVQRKIDGHDIISTIDTRYQDVAESALRKALTTYGGRSGCAVLMEMSTGYVLACSNLAYDTVSHGFREMPDRNIAVSDIYEPGSTFKTVVMATLLADNTIGLDTTMMVQVGTRTVPGSGKVVHDDHILKGRDSLSVKEVLEQSSNVGMSNLAWQYYRNRRDTLVEMVKKIFPYDVLHVDVAAPEIKSKIPNLNRSNDDLMRFSFGYVTSVNAMQVLTFYNAIGNNGRMVKPLFCRGFVENGKIVEVRPVVLREKVFSREVLDKIKSMLLGVTDHGTAWRAMKGVTYGIAGKTGTAYATYPNRAGDYNASFAGYFPAENPKYSCIVILKRTPVFGGQAATVFRTIADGVVAMDKELNSGAAIDRSDDTAIVRKPVLRNGNSTTLRNAYRQLDMNRMLPKNAPYWVTYFDGDDSTEAGYRQLVATEGLVPDCTGMTVKDAIELLHSQGLKAKFSGYGKVTSQNPRPNAKCNKGNTVFLTLR